MVTAHWLACASARAAVRIWPTSVWLRTALLFMGVSSVQLGQGGFDQFDPVPHRGSTCAVEVRLAADVGRDNDLGMATFQGVELVVSQLPRQFGLSQRIGARRTAAQVPIRYGRQGETEPGQQRFHGTAEFLSVLQGAGAMECHALRGMD